ncbi:hypothetical protein ISE1_2605 [plant metagenome]|uniref:Uncharacterized protein n=1 Tax=plant metagenome TaxID=1297885 RepID=A0A484UX28_9ZZZZ
MILPRRSPRRHARRFLPPDPCVLPGRASAAACCGKILRLFFLFSGFA